MLSAFLGAAARAVQLLPQLPRLGLVGLVRGYRFWLQPWLGNVCRYEPSCSSYALQALQQHGAAKGLVLAVWRVLRCNPWSHGGNDAVPAAGQWRCAHGPGESCARSSDDLNQNSRGLLTRHVQPEATSNSVDAVPVNRNQP